jgi:TPR repeat protein
MKPVKQSMQSMKEIMIGLMLFIAILLTPLALTAQVDTFYFSAVLEKANQGDRSAAFAIGQMYRDGEGCTVDPVASYQWFYIANRLGESAAFVAADELAESMAPQQLRQAQQQAKVWMAGYLAEHGNPDNRQASN